jgi:LmbE family N-acetylglucosaminyl deacetylase
MLALNLASRPGRVLKILCLGAHADDIEIGCGGLLLSLRERRQRMTVDWVVLSAPPGRDREARSSADLFLQGLRRKRVIVKEFRDGFFPHDAAEIKATFELLKRDAAPDLVLTHYRDDRHQDHRIVSDLTWNTFRDHWILEYEIPKYDGDLGSPNVFVPLDRATCARKVRHLERAFGSQRDKHWFSAETFLGLMRLRGVECRAPGGYAEAFYGRKVLLGGFESPIADT